MKAFAAFFVKEFKSQNYIGLTTEFHGVNLGRLLTNTGMGTNIRKKYKIEQLLIKTTADIQMEKIENLVDEI